MILLFRKCLEMNCNIATYIVAIFTDMAKKLHATNLQLILVYFLFYLTNDLWMFGD